MPRSGLASQPRPGSRTRASKSAGLITAGMLCWSALEAPASAKVTLDMATDVPDVHVLGAVALDAAKVIATGDLNADGHVDLVFGAQAGSGPDGNRPGAGKVYAYFGPFSSGSTLDLALGPDVLLHGAIWVEGIRLGASIAVADVSGDGVDDLIVGAPYASHNRHPRAGAVLVFFGPLGRGTVIDLETTSADYTVWGAQSSDYLGKVAAGDLGGDATPDLLFSSTGTSNRGQVSALFGPLLRGGVFDLETSTPDVAIKGVDINDSAGDNGIRIGDLSGDRIPDLVIAAVAGHGPGNSRGSFTGEVAVLFGPFITGNVWDMAATAPSVTLYGSDSGDFFGSSIEIGDLDDDGFGDLLIGVPNADGPAESRTDCGEVNEFSGPLTPGTIDVRTTPPTLRVFGRDPGDRLAEGIMVGHVQGADAPPSLLLGTSVGSGPGNARAYCGEAYLLFAPGSCIDLDLAAEPEDVIVYGEETRDGLGGPVIFADIDEDGRDDLVLSAGGADGPLNARQSAGEIYGIFSQWPAVPCGVPPEHVTGLTAVRRASEVELTWDEATDASTAVYDVWRIANGDRSLLPQAGRELARTVGNVQSVRCCLRIPRTSPRCVDSDGASNAPTVFYQVRASCTDGTEDI